MSLAQPRRVREFSVALGVLLGIFAVTVLIGWLIGADAITRVAPDLKAVKPTSALGLLLVGVTVAAPSRRVVLVALSVLALVSGLSIIAQLTSTDLGLDVIIVDHHVVMDSSGRMALLTAGCLFLLAMAGFARLSDYPVVVSQTCSVIAFVGAWTCCVGYFFGSPELYRIGPYSSVEINTAIGLAVAAAASLAAVPKGLLVWMVSGRDPGAVTMRRVLPIAVVILPVMGLIEVLGHRYDWFPYPFAIAATTGASAVLLLLSVGVTARRLRRADRTRTEAEFSLLSINATLEHKVAERSQALAKERAQMAVFRERDRIAADLHDNVVQTLFGAGLQLDLLQTQVTDPAHASRIASSIDDIHVAIAALRGSIFELKNPGPPTNLHASLSALTVRAGRLMTNAPALTITGDADDVPIHIADAILAVCQEALSNVARHAEASHCRVEVQVDGGAVTLRVGDDGCGMPPELPHSSGVENIGTRAADLGGQARWEARDPRGTTLIWSVPIPAARALHLNA